MKYEETHEIAPITRMVDGKQVTVELIKPEIAKRIEELGKLNDRYNEYVAAGNWTFVLKLSEEYKARGMINMAAKLRQEAVEHGERTIIEAHETITGEFRRSRPSRSRSSGSGVHSGTVAADRRSLSKVTRAGGH